MEMPRLVLQSYAVNKCVNYRDDKLTERIIYCIIRVHQGLGPGFREDIYRRALHIELTNHNLVAQTEKEIPIYYAGHPVGSHRLDMVVQNSVVIELKTVEALRNEHYAQIRSYMKATDIERGILVNFAAERADYRRVELTKSPAKEIRG